MYRIKEIGEGKIEFGEFDSAESLVTLFPEGVDYLKDRTVTYKGKKYSVEKYTTNGLYTDDVLVEGGKSLQLKEVLKVTIVPCTINKVGKGAKGGSDLGD